MTLVLEILGAWLVLGVLTIAILHDVKHAVARHASWEHVESAGLFDFDRALWVGHGVMAWLEEHGYSRTENVEEPT